ncbi:hypothetical protein C2S51_018716 [Perilla frutescens var. frutescens]|nr:hypothetical protein C2S51_018716 [Perilla frutescens var. frutescens]
MVDNASGGDTGGRIAKEVSNIYETMAMTSQQKSALGERASVNEANPSYDVTKQLAELTREVEMLHTSERPPQQVMTVETCGICGEYGHGANLCQRSIEPESSEEAHFHALQEQVHALQGFQPRQPYNPYSQSYNPPPPPQQARGDQAPPYPRPQQYPAQPNQPPRPTLQDTLQSFIQATQ